MTREGDREQARLRMQMLRHRAALRDPTTGLEAFGLHLDAVREMLTERRRIGVLWVSLAELRVVESIHGWEAYDAILRDAADRLRAAIGRELPPRARVTTTGVHADAFVVFIASAADGSELAAGDLAAMAASLTSALGAPLREATGEDAPGGAVRVGAALLVDNPFHRFERRAQQAIDEARRLAEAPAETQRLAWLGELQRLVREGDIRCLFQPIVDLETGRPVAVEAFARGPRDSALRYPRVLFSLGRDAGLGAELDRLSRRTALTDLARVDPSSVPRPVFLNTSADCLLDPDWLSSDTADVLTRAGLTARDVVLECAESQLVAALELYREGLERLRAAGYRFSLDDVGSGARSVAVIETLRPEFVKFDVTLVRRAEASQLARELVRSLSGLAARAGACLVAERIETPGERDALRSCGASWGQGRLFGGERPIDALTGAGQRERGAP